jgi:hypothetical protein
MGQRTRGVGNGIPNTFGIAAYTHGIVLVWLVCVPLFLVLIV